MSQVRSAVGGYASLSRGRHQGRTIAAFVRGDSVEDANGRELTSFHVLSAPPDTDLGRLTRPTLVLDRTTLDRHYREAMRPLGAIDAKAGSRLSRRIALRLAHLCGRRMHAETGIDQGVAAKAWFFAIWTEVCILIPARHLARRLAKLAAGDLILLPLPSRRFNYLGYWEPNQLEPFYLAAELQKRCAAVAFVLTDADTFDRVERRKDVNLRFSPHPFCLPRTHAIEPAPNEAGPTAALVGAGIRGVDVIRSRLNHVKVVESLFTVGPVESDVGLFPGSEPPATLTIGMREVSAYGGGPLIRTFRCEPKTLSLPDLLTAGVGRATRNASDRARALVESLNVRDVHICDHGYVETALMADAVHRRGGHVFLWPHSSNAVHTELRELGEIAAITCATKSAAKTWQHRCPGIPCRVESALMFPYVTEPSTRALGEPLTIVVIGGAHALRRMPLMARDAHVASYRGFFRGLAAFGSTVRIVFKPKTIWETTDWVREIVGDDIPFSETIAHPTQIDETNMVFVTISLGSSALLEGISRRVPCLVVRDTQVEDYVGLDPAAIPIGDTDTSLAIIAALRDVGAYDALLQRELEWFRDEIGEIEIGSQECIISCAAL